MGNKNVSTTLTCSSEPSNVAGYFLGSYKSNNKVAGILYLRRISDKRWAEPVLTHLMMPKRSWGGIVPPQRIVLATTMWSWVDLEIGRRREEAIQELWRPMAELGSGMTRFEGTTESAWQIVDLLLGVDRESRLSWDESQETKLVQRIQ